MNESVLVWCAVVALFFVILLTHEVRRTHMNSRHTQKARRRHIVGMVKESDIIYVPGDLTDGCGDDYWDF